MDWCHPSYASLSFHKDDLIRFLNFPSPLTRAAEPIIASAWSPGIQKDSPAPGSHTYKLRSKPWTSTADASSVASRRLVRDILAHLHAHGWFVVASLGHSIRIGSKDSLIFRHAPSPPTTPTTPSSPLPSRWLALSIIKSDRLRIDSADPRLQTRAVTALRALVDRTGYFLAGDWTCDAYEFRLRDKPWNAHGDTGWARPRMLILGILEALDAEGWRSYVAVAQSTVNDEAKKPDSWYFVMDSEPPGETPPTPTSAVEAPKALVRTESRPWGSRNPYAQAWFIT
ncbi:hypothetical protein B0T11DRAFT_290003 [Plectosphaerella cucumerina]|jgi:hypothetical protein|uniref:Uncharacterized protein n=1 Tax=Plectosphaerella cucumerina TaxID=40658 RepID=A0A8K0T8D5_9PEZI|nr:hypothetical protein B0T11DRAFT_290003 [Plectosphaerella cucumerina]